jgi:hypothetical protein
MRILKIYSTRNLYCILIVCSILFLTSCTDNFSEINTSKNSISSTNIGRAEMKYLFTAALEQMPIFHQTTEWLYSQQYAQYIANTTTYFPSDRYTINMGWAAYPFEKTYVQVLPQLQTIMDYMEDTSVEYALASIWWVYAVQRLTDYWGPVPYSQAGGASAEFVPYDSVEDIYMDFLAKLKNANSALEDQLDVVAFGGDPDIIYEGNLRKWKKLANTLRLRCAMRISRVDPATAKTEAEAAVAEGVFEISPDDDALMETTLNSMNRLSEMSEWFEFGMSATMESILKGYNDPRISEFFMPAENTETYEGIRNGLSIMQLSKPQNDRLSVSHIGPRWSAPSRGGWPSYFTTPYNIMSTSEAYFLRAEGVLLGWDMGGSAKDLYEEGIKNSMVQWGIIDQGLIQVYVNGENIPIAPDDYLNSPPATDVPVKFNTGDLSIQKKQIAVQKWLALFPDGCEAWADYRRNHDVLPLYPVANSENPDIPDPTKNWIRRLPFLTTEYEVNGDGVKTGLEVLNGADKVTTPIWWDVN